MTQIHMKYDQCVRALHADPTEIMLFYNNHLIQLSTNIAVYYFALLCINTNSIDAVAAF